MSVSWIKLHRNIKDRQWYKDIPCKVVFLHLMILAQYKRYKYNDIELLPGQILTGRKQLAKETGLTVQQVRTALSKLQSSSEITLMSDNKCSIITLNNWEKDQCNSVKKEKAYNAYV